MVPEISIIVPVYNVEKYLNRCINSILVQTYTNFELVLVDDGSVDESGKICDKYAEKDCRIVVIHQDNQGVSVARNTGLKVAKGKYIGFVDADDIINPYMYERLLIAIKDSDSDLSVCDIRRFEEEAELEEAKTNKLCINTNDIQILNREMLLKDLFSTPSQMQRYCFNKLMKKTCCQNISFLEGMKIWEDFKFLCEIYLEENCNKATKVPMPLYYYRMNNESVTHSKSSLVYGKKHFKEEIFDYIYKKDLEYAGLAVDFFLDSSIYFIKNCREAKKNYKGNYAIKILDVKITILWWVLFCSTHGLMSKEKRHRYLYEGVLKA